MTFPPNPTDGMIVEFDNNVYYQYSAKDHTWVRLEDYNLGAVLATPMEDGLMSSVDFKKLYDLMLPPPKTTLTSEDCTYIFEKGFLGIFSSNEDLFIESELPLMDKDDKGFSVERKQVWQIHENTFGINFRVNLNQLVSELESRGQLTYRKSAGEQGKKGAKGKPGVDKLDTGPRGTIGDDGKNAAYPGDLVQDLAILVSDDNRGIVDITKDEVSPDENYLLVTRASIGNPDFCPEFVKPKTIQSKWIAVLDESPATRKVYKDCGSKGDKCIPATCTLGQDAMIRNLCSTNLYYLDMTSIEQTIRTRFDELLVELKEVKEQVANEYLKAMVEIYNEQKLAVCCAVENCESRRENDRHKERIEMLRVMAAGPQKALTIDGDLTRDYVDTNPGKDCPAPDAGTQSSAIIPTTCEYKMLVVGSVNAPNESYSSTVDLPAGEYVVTISGCCCFNNEIDVEPEDISPQIMVPCELYLGARKSNSQALVYSVGAIHLPELYEPDNFTVSNAFTINNQFKFKYVKIPVLRVGTSDGSGYSLRVDVMTDINGAPGSIIASAKVPASVISTWNENVKPTPGHFMEVSVDFGDRTFDAGTYFFRISKDGSTSSAEFFLISVSNMLASDVGPFYSDGEVIPGVEIFLCAAYWNIEQTGFRVSTGITEEQYEIFLANPELVDPSFKPKFDAMLPYSSRITLVYQGPFGEVSVDTPNQNDYRTKAEASAANLGRTVQFKHFGGKLKAYYTRGGTSKITNNNGSVELCVNRVPVSNPNRPQPACTGFVSDITVLGGSNTFAITPHTFQYKDGAYTPILIPNPTNSSVPQVIDLPGPGVYELEIMDCCFFDAQDVNLSAYPVFPPGFYISKSSPTRILVTQGMYEKAVLADTGGFMLEWAAGDAVIATLPADLQDRFIKYSSTPASTDYDTIRDVVSKAIQPYTGVVTAWYTGYATGSPTSQTLIARTYATPDSRPVFEVDENGYFTYTGKPPQDSEFGGYRSSSEATTAFIGKKFRINSSGGKLALFFDDYDAGFGSLVEPIPNPNSGQVVVRVSCVDEPACDIPELEITLNCGINIAEISSIMADLVAGEYVAQISDCCCGNGGSWKGMIALKYLNTGIPKTLYSPDLGSFSTDLDAQQYYMGNSFAFIHSGGQIKVWASTPMYSAGLITVSIWSRKCLDRCNTNPAGGSTGISAIDPQPVDVFTNCDMTSDQINFYECGWQTGACCGAWVEALGTMWIVVMRSLGADMACGGGESELSDCIKKGLAAGFYPAIAFPTIDGNIFLGKPTSGFQRFVRDVDVEAEILAKIRAGEVWRIVGDPITNIGGILFPADFSHA
jgi:hypothetical protein